MHPIDADDWIILNDKVVPIIRYYYNIGFKIVIFSNQGGIEKGKAKESDIKTKIQNIGDLVMFMHKEILYLNIIDCCSNASFNCFKL